MQELVVGYVEAQIGSLSVKGRLVSVGINRHNICDSHNSGSKCRDWCSLEVNTSGVQRLVGVTPTVEEEFDGAELALAAPIASEAIVGKAHRDSIVAGERDEAEVMGNELFVEDRGKELVNDDGGYLDDHDAVEGIGNANIGVPQLVERIVRVAMSNAVGFSLFPFFDVFKFLNVFARVPTYVAIMILLKKIQ